MEFKEFKSNMQRCFQAMTANPNKLFLTSVDKYVLWDTYLNSFSEEDRQGNNCNCCKSFIRNYGSVVALKEQKDSQGVVTFERLTLWDFDASGEFAETAKSMKALVSPAPITEIFLSKEKQLGTDSNKEVLEDKQVITWHHLALTLPTRFIDSSASSIEAIRGTYRANKEVFKRSLDEISKDAVETVLELIAQDSIYRGTEFTYVLKEFLNYQKAYSLVVDKDSYCWAYSANLPPSIAKIRNTAIGTLLVDVSNGVDLDRAVTSFERMMNAGNYKRPKAIVTQSMIEAAKKEVEALGLLPSLNRRMAAIDDVNINDILFKDRDAKKATDVFGMLKEEVTVNPKSFSKVEEISISDFISNVLPTATRIEALLENSHLPNFMTLVTAEDSAAINFFKWSNPFSWSYTNAVADSIKERVKDAGGHVDGELRVSLSWHNFDDLDLHVTETNGNTIYYSNRRSSTGGELDVDMNAGGGQTRKPVENISWKTNARMSEGTYTVKVNNFSKRDTADTGFSVQIECQGQVYDFDYEMSPQNKGTVEVVKFTYTKRGGIVMPETVKSVAAPKDKWGLSTYRFYKVSLLMLSPNYWGDTGVGNKHFFFMLEGAKTDEITRGFFNEFLTDSLIQQHKRVFEVLANKIAVTPAEKELSGLGFSSTQRQSLIVKVTGKTQRVLKINF